MYAITDWAMLLTIQYNFQKLKSIKPNELPVCLYVGIECVSHSGNLHGHVFINFVFHLVAQVEVKKLYTGSMNLGLFFDEHCFYKCWK